MTRWGLTGIALTGLLAAGCARGPEFVAVEGTVTLNGKPLPEVEVVFLPDSGAGNPGPRSAAYTDQQGRYKLFCDQSGRTGTVAGPTRVCVIDITAVVSLADMPGAWRPVVFRGRRDGRPGATTRTRSRVPPAYGSVARTPLRVVVAPGQTVFDFDIAGVARW
jgi:hypothetical protein